MDGYTHARMKVCTHTQICNHALLSRLAVADVKRALSLARARARAVSLSLSPSLPASHSRPPPSPHTHCCAQPKQQMPMQLYEYHVPGDYLGGDGGVDSDYDEVRTHACRRARAHARTRHSWTWTTTRSPHQRARARERERERESDYDEAPHSTSCTARTARTEE